MEKKKDERKDGLGKKFRRVFKTNKNEDILIKPKNVYQHASTPDRHHINVLNSKLNDAMEKISALEWEKDKLEGEVADLSNCVKKLTKRLNYYKSTVSTVQDQYESDISSKEREIRNMKIQHEADILNKEKIIIDQEDTIKQQESSLLEMNTVRKFVENNDDNIPKTKGSLILEMLIFHENLRRVLNNTRNNVTVVDTTEEMINNVQLLINEFNNSLNIKADITNQVILLQLKDIFKYLDVVLEYAKNNEVFRESIELINLEFKKVLSNEGVEEIPTEGLKFNSDIHEAISVENDKNIEDGYIIEEFAKGYTINGNVIKRAQVKVCKKNS